MLRPGDRVKEVRPAISSPFDERVNRTGMFVFYDDEGTPWVLFDGEPPRFEAVTMRQLQIVEGVRLRLHE